MKTAVDISAKPGTRAVLIGGGAAACARCSRHAAQPGCRECILSGIVQASGRHFGGLGFGVWGLLGFRSLGFGV